MNIKKFFLVSCFMLQLSITTSIKPAMQLSDTINWTAAFSAFPGGVSAVYNKTIPATMPASIPYGSPTYRNAIVIGQYLSVPGAGITTGVLNATDLVNLNNAFTAAGINKPTVQTPLTPTGKQFSDTTHWTAAFAAFPGGASAVYNKTVPATMLTTMPVSITSTSPEYGNAQVILQYLSVLGAGDMSGIASPLDRTNLHNAFMAPVQTIGVIINNSPQNLHIIVHGTVPKYPHMLAKIDRQFVRINQVLPIHANASCIQNVEVPFDTYLELKRINPTESHSIDLHYAVNQISNSSFTITNYSSNVLNFNFYGTIDGKDNSVINVSPISINPNESCPIMPGAVSVSAIPEHGIAQAIKATNLGMQPIAANTSYIIGQNLKMN